MRYVIFSDIHSNLEALEAVLEAFSKERVDKYLCLGDIVGYGADPNECARRVKALAPFVVAGNHDWACMDKTNIIDYFNDAAKTAILWTKKTLDEAGKEYLNSLELVKREDNIMLVHATLENPQEFGYIQTLGAAKRSLDLLDSTNVCFIGHSHAPVIFLEDGGQIRYSFRKHIKIAPNIKYIINVGSVGQPRDGNPQSCYAVYDSDLGTVEIKRIKYNVKKAKRKIIAAGLPYFLADRLEMGR